MEDFKVRQAGRPRGVSPTTSAEEWIRFLTEGGLYDKTIRTKEDAIALGKPTVIYPDLTNVRKFYAFRRDTGLLISLQYETDILTELNPGGFPEEQVILLSELKPALGLQAGGGRRRSRKAKKNKAHNPQ
jgi:hypothetical protein